MSEHTLNVAQLIDERRMTKFNILVTVLSFVAVWFDGYDLSCIPFAVPYMVKAWHITDPRLLGPVFSASLFGGILGATVFGYRQDHE